MSHSSKRIPGTSGRIRQVTMAVVGPIVSAAMICATMGCNTANVTPSPVGACDSDIQRNGGPAMRCYIVDLPGKGAKIKCVLYNAGRAPIFVRDRHEPAIDIEFRRDGKSVSMICRSGSLPINEPFILLRPGSCLGDATFLYVDLPEPLETMNNGQLTINIVVWMVTHRCVDGQFEERPVSVETSFEVAERLVPGQESGVSKVVEIAK